MNLHSNQLCWIGMISIEVLLLVCNCQLKVLLVKSTKMVWDRAKESRPGQVVKLTTVNGKMTAAMVMENRLMAQVTTVRSTKVSGQMISDMVKANWPDLVVRQLLVLGKMVSLMVQPRSKKTVRQLKLALSKAVWFLSPMNTPWSRIKSSLKWFYAWLSGFASSLPLPTVSGCQFSLWFSICLLFALLSNLKWRKWSVIVLWKDMIQ